MALTQISTAGVKDDAVTAGKIPANAVGSSELADNAVDTAAIADQAVDLTKLPHGTGSNDGKFLRANNGADPTFETVNTDLSADSSPQLGGNLDCNGSNIFLDDNNKIHFGNLTGSTGDLQIYHSPSDNCSYIDTFHHLQIRKDNGAEIHAKFTNNEGTTLYYDNVQTFNTEANGIKVLGPADGVAQVEIYSDRGDDNQDKWRIQASSTGEFLKFQTYGSGSWQDTISAQSQNQVRLFYNGSEKLNTINTGVAITGKIYMNNGNLQFGTSGAGVDFSSTSDASGMTSELLDDYEDGTWTINPHDGSCTSFGTRYTKIGNTVTVWGRATAFSDTSTNDLVRLKGLPYSATSSNFATCCGPAMAQYINEDSGWVAFVEGDQIKFYGSSSGSFDQLRHNELNSGHEIYFSATYTTV